MEEIVLAPYTKGYLDVGDGHNIYYEACGNPHGKPILYLHGGPGAGFSDNSKNKFDPSLWNIILFDQRGSGRSTPFASLEHNTTDDLVGDINKLLDFLHIEKVTLFGGSWGSTLALVYAIRNKERINGMVLRGIFLPSKEDNNYMFGGGIQRLAPEAWERFVSQVPDMHKSNPALYYFQQMKSSNPALQEKFTYEWAYYEMSLLNLRPSKKLIEEGMEDNTYRSLSPLEAHYLLNNCFLPENYILDHAAELSGIPTIIINGKYDLICPPLYAYSLHKKIAGSRLFWTIAGHASSDAGNKRKLLWAVKEMYPLV